MNQQKIAKEGHQIRSLFGKREKNKKPKQKEEKKKRSIAEIEAGQEHGTRRKWNIIVKWVNDIAYCGLVCDGCK